MFKSYQQYKQSGVEWLGDVPSHWSVVKNKYIYNYRQEPALANDEIITAFRDGQVTLRKYRRSEGFTNSIQEHGYQHIHKGDLVIHEMDAFAGAIGVAEYSGKSTPVYTVLYPRQSVNNFFFACFFRTMAKVGYISSLAKGIRVRSTDFRWGTSKNVYLCYPLLLEQTQIATYLDQETQKIDNLILKQEKLIELLEEQRKSIISYAVTKGIDPHVKMKDSGVEWLGEVPEHWEVTKLKFLFSFNKGLTITKDDLQEYGIPCINYGEIHSKYGFDFDPKRDPLKCVDERYLMSDPKSLLKFGDFVFADTSEDFEGSGNFSYLNSDIRTFAGYHTIILKLKANCIHRFLAYAMESTFFRNQIRHQVKGIKVFSISQNILKNLNISLPDIEEQLEIVNFLDKKSQDIKAIVQKQTALIEKLKEYRSSIISHAVTGKIDVRHLIS